MSRTVLHILSAAYSGSSLLNLLLNSQPDIRGLGESVHLRRQTLGIHCLACQVPAAQCALQEVLSPTAFYSSLFDYYGQPAVLVDASKNLWDTFLELPAEPGLEHTFVILSKSPHEFAASWTRHHPQVSVWAAFQIYVQCYTPIAQALRDSQRVASDRVRYLTYRRLATTPDAAVTELCQLAGVPAYPLADRTWWAATGHIIGGNALVAAQTTGLEAFLLGASPDDRQRYQGHAHQVFYDQAWRQSPQFIRECLTAYDAHAAVLPPLLAELGHVPLDMLRDEMTGAQFRWTG